MSDDHDALVRDLNRAAGRRPAIDSARAARGYARDLDRDAERRRQQAIAAAMWDYAMERDTPGAAMVETMLARNAATRGRPAVEGHRRPNGRLSERRGARPDQNDGLVESQPHRHPFRELIGAHAAGDARASSALGRLRLIGEAEERDRVGRVSGREHVRRVLFGDAATAPEGPFGISAAQYASGLRLFEAVGRERFVRAAPKDKPSAIAFMTARGIDCAVRDIDDATARQWVADFEDARAALAAAHWMPDAQRVLRIVREQLRRFRRAGAPVEDTLRLASGLAVMINPRASAEIVRAVNGVVIEDRDPPFAELAAIRRGLDALTEHFGATGDSARRPAGAAWHAGEQSAWRGFDGVTAVRTAEKPDRDHPYR